MSTVKATHFEHPSASTANITLAADGSVVFDSVPATIQSAIDAVPVLAGIGSNVVQTVKTDTFTTTDGNFTDVTGLTVTITPTSSSNKVLLIADISLSSSENTYYAYWALTDSSNNFVQDPPSATKTESFINHGSANDLTRQMRVALVSPATTSPVTYKVRAGIAGGGGRFVGVNRSSANNITSVSTLTAIEVAA